MGTMAREALAQAPGMEYAGGLARMRSDAHGIVDNLPELLAHKPDVLLDLTTHPSTVQITLSAVAQGVRCVIGATGWSHDERAELREAVQTHKSAAMLVPNFSIGAALMMRFAESAAPFFPSVEVIELHHDRKKDAPSGTARLTAERIGGVREGMVPIHSVRMRGLLAHQEVLFGNDGELLTIRHDSLARESFATGMLACIRRVGTIEGVEIGLDGVIDAAREASSSV